MTYKLINQYLENWAIFGLTIFLLGFFFFSSSSTHNTIYYIGVCVPIVLLLPFYVKKLKIQSWLTVSALVLAFYLFLNSWWAIEFSIGKSLKYLKYLFILYCLFAAVFIFHNKRASSTKLLFIALVVVGSLSSIYGIYDHFNKYMMKSIDPLLYRYNDPIHSAMLAGLVLLTCFWLMIESHKYKYKFYYLLLSIPLIVLIFLSKARGPQLALILTLIPFCYFQIENIKKHLTLLVYLVISFSLCLMVLLFSGYFDQLFSKGLSFPYRLDIWAASLQEAYEHFWFGQGATRKPTPLIASEIAFDHSHCIALAIFRMGGIVGLILFSINLALCFLAGFKQKKSIQHLWLIWLFFGVICLMTNGKYPLTRPSTSWFAYWVPMAFICASLSRSFLLKNSCLKK